MYIVKESLVWWLLLGAYIIGVLIGNLPTTSLWSPLIAMAIGLLYSHYCNYKLDTETDTNTDQLKS